MAGIGSSTHEAVAEGRATSPAKIGRMRQPRQDAHEATAASARTAPATGCWGATVPTSFDVQQDDLELGADASLHRQDRLTSCDFRNSDHWCAEVGGRPGCGSCCARIGSVHAAEGGPLLRRPRALCEWRRVGTPAASPKPARTRESGRRRRITAGFRHAPVPRIARSVVRVAEGPQSLRMTNGSLRRRLRQAGWTGDRRPRCGGNVAREGPTWHIFCAGQRVRLPTWMAIEAEATWLLFETGATVRFRPSGSW